MTEEEKLELLDKIKESADLYTKREPFITNTIQKIECFLQDYREIEAKRKQILGEEKSK